MAESLLQQSKMQISDVKLKNRDQILIKNGRHDGLHRFLAGGPIKFSSRNAKSINNISKYSRPEAIPISIERLLEGSSFLNWIM